MRICIVADTFPSLSETFVVDQALCLLARGHEVEVLCQRANWSAGPASAAAGALAGRTRCWWGPASALGGVTARLSPRWKHRVGTALDLVSARRLSRCDVIVAHFGYAGVRVARLARRVRKLPPLVTIFHGHDVATVGPERLGSFYADLFAVGARYLTVNDAFRRMLVAAGAPDAHTRVHHLGARIDTIPFSPRRREGPPETLLSVCRLTEKKGLAYALQALAQVRRRDPAQPWRYRIVGDGEQRAELERASEALGLSDRVEFLGARSSEEVRRHLAEADVFLLPSLTAANGDAEGIPVSLMEAMASGAIVVSTVHSGIPELVTDGLSGLLAPERDADALAEKLSSLLRMPAAARAEIAAAARSRVEEGFDVRRQTETLERELTTLVEEARSRAPSA